MYSACLTCHRDLGRNSQVASFPVGRRIAFSPHDGRLWAVCTHCGEWNLAPIHERWEAVSECEEVYERTLERGSTEGVALGRIEGLELLHLGAEEELPTLRYGARLWEREKRHATRRRLRRVSRGMFYIGVAAVGALAGGFGGLVLGLFLGGLVFDLAAALADPVVARVPSGRGEWTEITRRELLDARLVPDGESGWRLRVRRGLETTGPEALEAARLMLPLLTRSREPEVDLKRALAYIEKKGGTVADVFRAAARRRGRRRTARLSKLEPHIRLALEMLASREVESRAVSESLDPLRCAWAAADELAEIQDELSYTPGILARFRDLTDGLTGR